MNKIFRQVNFVFLFLAVATMTFAQDSEVRSLESFNGISVSSSIDAEIRHGSTNEVEVFVQNVELHEVETKISGGVLKLGMRKKSWSSGLMKKKKVRVVVTYTDQLEYLSAGSSSDMVVKDVVKTDELEIKVSSSADMDVEVDTDDLEVSVSSSADLNISGYATNGYIKASSSSDFNGDDLEIEHADISASSSADVTVGVSKSIEAKASSSADIVYYGNPSQRDVSKSSSGTIRGKSK